MKISNELSIAINAAIDAGISIMRIYDSMDLDVEYKKDTSPLTQADILSNNIICNELNKTNTPIISEENKSIPYSLRKEWTKFWLVDPLDGTKEFLKKNGEFTVNIALIENQIPILGVVYAPALNVIYFSEKQKGAFKSIINDVQNSSATTLKRNSKKLPLTKENGLYKVATSRSHISDVTKVYIDKIKRNKKNFSVVPMGSSLKICLVAEGEINIYPRLSPTMEWDTAAAHSICIESNKNINSLNNKVLKYNKRQLINPSFIVK